MMMISTLHDTGLKMVLWLSKTRFSSSEIHLAVYKSLDIISHTTLIKMLQNSPERLHSAFQHLPSA